MRLEAPTGPVPLFTPARVQHLPPPARRWLIHAIQPDTPLLTTTRLSMHGRIRIGAWWRFQAEQILRPPTGFVWAATTHLAGVPVTGFDRYTDGAGQMRWRLLGALPLISAAGPDTTRSAAGRLAAEFVLSPASALAPWITWEPIDDHQALARVTIGPRTHLVTVTVAASGALTSVSLPRWGNPDGHAHRQHTFGVKVYSETTFDGFTIPSYATAGWWHGTDRWADGQFIRFRVDHASFR
ncbi:DUF6544 family protein [Spirillospora sp. NPDC048911]|uniref:DUF6544 family protein n=1 Tax=Spirillospora sp. NPDC048911 TaxID=3364527 RepID=UPI00371ED7A9